MATHGNNRKAFLTTESADKMTWIEGEQNNNLNLEAEMLEATDKSSKWRQYVPGMKGGTAEVTLFANYGTEQLELLSSLTQGNAVYCYFGEVDDDNKPNGGEFFQAFVSSIGTPAENGSLVTRSVSLQISGEVMIVPAH